jgi:hypothetical protein
MTHSSTFFPNLIHITTNIIFLAASLCFEHYDTTTSIDMVMGCAKYAAKRY